MLNSLTIEARLRERGRVAFGEWMIDGIPLRDWAETTAASAAGRAAKWDVVGLPTEESVSRRMVASLLRRGPAELESGRSVLYRCPECLDVGCGVFAVRVEREGDEIVWRDFAWEGRGAAVPPFGDQRFGCLPPLRFDPRQYYGVLSAAAAGRAGHAKGPAAG